MEEIKDGTQCRFTTTDEFLKIAEEVYGKKLDWFWEVYFRQASLPVLNQEIKDDMLYLDWQTENDIPFNIPVEINVGDKITKVEMMDGKGSIKIPKGTEPVIDPNGWITMGDTKNDNTEIK